MKNTIDFTPMVMEAPKTKQTGFRPQTANERVNKAMKEPIPAMLFDEFWYEGEVCILFGESNCGKSILATQIADSISKTDAIPGFLKDALPHKVLYLDFEMSNKQFQMRYCNKDGENPYQFNDRLIISGMFSGEDMPDNTSYVDYFFEELKHTIESSQADVIIVDNITWLNDVGTESSKDASPLMKRLKTMKNDMGLSILVLAHTPKRRLSAPLTRNDLAGSKVLNNFCDSMFAIGESNRDKSLRYLIQFKARNDAHKFDSKNVAVCKITKENPDNFLRFEFVGYAEEWEHLPKFGEEEVQRQRQETSDKVKKMREQGLSQRQIAEQTGKSLGTINRILKNLNDGNE